MPPIPLRPATTLTTFRGKPVDLVMKAFLEAMEARLGYELTVVQGYNPDNTQTSAGTHSYGVVDLAAYDADRKVRVLKDLGGFGWYRSELPGVWGPHIHFGIRNHPGLSSTARRQQVDFDARPPMDGLAGHDTPDPTYHPAPPVQFAYPPKEKPVPPTATQVTQARDSLVEAIHACGEAIAHLKDADAERVVARGQRGEIRDAKDHLEAVLEVLPKR